MRPTTIDPAATAQTRTISSKARYVRTIPPKLRLLVYVFWLVILGVVSSLLLTNAHQLTLLAQEGQMTAATITAKHMSATDSYDYYVDYHLEVKGRWYTGTAAVSREVYNRSQPGDPFPITYLSANPAITQQGKVDPARAADTRRAGALWFGFLTLCFVGLTWGMERYFRR